MKLNKYIGMAVMPMLFAACQNDLAEESIMKQDQPIYTLSGKMDKGVNSRAQIQLGNQDVASEIFMWNEGDSFNLYQGNEAVTFHISSDYSEAGEGDKTQASFRADVPVYPGSYLAVYPSTVPVENDRLAFAFQRDLEFSNATTQEERDAVWKEYFQNNMFMMAKGELTIEGSNALHFKHMTSLARITYHNGSNNEQTIYNFALRGDQLYGTNKEFTFQGQHTSGGATTGFNMNLNGGLTVAAGDSVDLYLLFFPERFREGELQLRFGLNDGSRSVSMPISDIAAANEGIDRFQEGMRYWFDVTATNGGLVFSKNYSAAPIIFENLEFAAALQKVLGSDMITIDPATGFGTMIEADVLGITNLDFGWNYCQISSLKGIENFKNLTSLNCCATGLTECDLSQNTALRRLDLSGNQELTSVNIDGCLNLNNLTINEVGLTSINIPVKENLDCLRYGRTALSFDLKEFPNLTYLSVYDLNLTSLDLIPDNLKAQLQFFECYDNEISSIDLTEFPNLTFLACYFNPLKSLDLTPLTHLRELNCHSCYIERLDITPLENLQTLYCGQQNDYINLVLVATDVQKDRWRNEWSNPDITWGLNKNVYLEGEEPEEVPEGSGTGNDFSNGGEF